MTKIRKNLYFDQSLIDFIEDTEGNTFQAKVDELLSKGIAYEGLEQERDEYKRQLFKLLAQVEEYLNILKTSNEAQTEMIKFYVEWEKLIE